MNDGAPRPSDTRRLLNKVDADAAAKQHEFMRSLGYAANQSSTTHDGALSVDRVTMTVPEAAQLLGLSESAAYDAAARGEIPSVRIGRRVLVKRDELLAMFDGSDTDV